MNKPTKANGYLRDLYRRPREGWIAGVCAGVAHSHGWPVWLARLIMVTLFIFSGSLGLLAYLAGIFLLEKAPQQHYGCQHDSGEAKPFFHYGPAPASRVKELHQRMQRLSERLGLIESYVTSRRYQVNRDFRDLS
ncbi:envelope stress response membrane protein PspC [Balneatrix alpica]|uniref:Envelope stress response membrane protein PspC n=1 Tax=Balneatrix alpica TaxID=75684 RepID=A0ABV5ZDQ7_9GAMM|nr:envelope stress response membrane protein PspC [Balneatrix alpica]